MNRAAAFDLDAALPHCALLAAGVWFAGIALRRPAGDGDLLWQQWLGERIVREHAVPQALGAETFSAPGAPWVPHEWLFSLAVAAAAARGAVWLVPLGCALTATLALAFVARRCARRGVSPVLAAGALPLCVLAGMQSFGARAQVIGWAGLSSALWLLEREDRCSLALVPLTAVWANLHASAFLAPVVAGARAAAVGLEDGRWSPRTARAAALALGCALATLATPFGLQLPRYAASLLTGPARVSISEWGPTSIASGSFVLGALPLILALTFGAGRLPLRDRVLAALCLAGLFAAVRNVPLFAIAVAPLAAEALSRAGATPSRPRAVPALVGTYALAALAFALLPWSRPALVDDPLPRVQAHELLRTAGSARVFCEDFAWCSLFLGAPAARVFLDGRCDPYPARVWDDYRSIVAGNPRWDEVLAAYRVTAVLARPESALDTLLSASPRWRIVSRGSRARVYLRSLDPPSHPPVLS